MRDSRESISFLRCRVRTVVLLAALGLCPHMPAQTAAAPHADKPYIVEWVYRVKWGYKEEFFDLFKKYQVAVLAREKQLGYVIDYAIYSPSLHTSEDTRWDYRVIITYKNEESAEHSKEITAQLFPDENVRRKEEQRRWEITEQHWDLPIHIVDLKDGE